MESILFSYHKDILKSLPQNARKDYERLFAEVIACQPAAEILKGLTNTKKLVAMNRAIELLDEEYLIKDPSHSLLLTPLVKANFRSLLAMAKLVKSGPLIEPVTRSKKTKDSAKLSTVNHHTVDVAKSAKASSKASVEPEPKAISKPKKVKKPTGPKLENVYSDLEKMLTSDQHVLSRNTFVECQDKDCTFCRSFFVNMQITKCVGHKKCTPSRWYPHFGPKLWSNLARYHNKPNSLFVRKERLLKDDELPSYSEHRYTSDSNSMTPKHSNFSELNGFDQDHISDSDDSSSTITECSGTSSRSSKRRASTSSELKDWATEVEEGFSPKRLASRTSTPSRNLDGY